MRAADAWARGPAAYAVTWIGLPLCVGAALGLAFGAQPAIAFLAGCALTAVALAMLWGDSPGSERSVGVPAFVAPDRVELAYRVDGSADLEHAVVAAEKIAPAIAAGALASRLTLSRTASGDWEAVVSYSAPAAGAAGSDVGRVLRRIDLHG